MGCSSATVSSGCGCSTTRCDLSEQPAFEKLEEVAVALIFHHQVVGQMMAPTSATRGGSQPTRASGRATRQVERLRYPASQPAPRRANPSPPPQREEPAVAPEPDQDLHNEVPLEEEVAGGGQVDANDEEFDADIAARCRPHIPQGDPTATRAPDSDGWSFIAKLGAY